MIIMHMAYITCLVTNDAWHAYDVNWSIRYIAELVGSHLLAEPAILRIAGTVMDEVGSRTI